MRIEINPRSDVPIYRQVETQVQALVASGRLRQGDRVPSVRELAMQLMINPNTVARAYQELYRAGVLETQRGGGTFVCVGQPEVERERAEAAFRQKLQEALTVAVSMGLDPERAAAICAEATTDAFVKDGEPDV